MYVLQYILCNENTRLSVYITYIQHIYASVYKNVYIPKKDIMLKFILFLFFFFFLYQNKKLISTIVYFKFNFFNEFLKGFPFGYPYFYTHIFILFSKFCIQFVALTFKGFIPFFFFLLKLFLKNFSKLERIFFFYVINGFL